MQRARHLFDCWPHISRRLRAAESVRLFLDFDGTLAPLCPRPADVRLSEETRRVLHRLVRHPRVRAAIVSGRRRAQLIELVSVPRLACWGLYGWESRERCMLSSRSRELVSRAFDIFKHRLNGLPGVRIEDKELTFALHTRGASPEATRSARALLRRTVASFQPGLHVLRGEKIWEVLPREVPGKGEFVRRVLQRASGSFLSVYVGDDDTDESAFAVLPRGITVRVGPGRRTRARYRLRDPGEVRAFLERAEGELR